MEALRAYILSVVSSAILCGIVKGLSGTNSTHIPVINLLCGLFMTMTMVKPLVEIRVEDLKDYTNDLQAEAWAISAQGEDIYESLLKARITESTEAYILDKAQAFSMEMEVTVSLDANRIPCEVVLKGEWEEMHKHKLQEILESELGIPKERQLWIG